MVSEKSALGLKVPSTTIAGPHGDLRRTIEISKRRLAGDDQRPIAILSANLDGARAARPAPAQARRGFASLSCQPVTNANIDSSAGATSNCSSPTSSRASVPAGVRASTTRRAYASCPWLVPSGRSIQWTNQRGFDVAAQLSNRPFVDRDRHVHRRPIVGTKVAAADQQPLRSGSSPHDTLPWRRRVTPSDPDRSCRPVPASTPSLAPASSRAAGPSAKSGCRAARHQ